MLEMHGIAMETTALCSLGTFPNPAQTYLLLFICFYEQYVELAAAVLRPF